MNGEAVSQPICDLVLLTWNRRDLLEPCVKRLLAHTRLPSRLLIVDNGSTDPETLAYLNTVKGTSWIETAVVRLPRNVGIAAALNAGLANVNAPWICLLNNDILVTAGWLEELIEVAEAHPTLGLLNPMSNEFGRCPSAGQTVDDVAQHCQKDRGRWIEAKGAGGFCVLLPGRIFRQVGYWDEAFQFMYFEDADYACRVRAAGFDCAIAEGAYVYHHGGATIKSDPTRALRFRENEERFYHKWQLPRPQRIACILSGRGTETAGPSVAWFRHLANTGHEIWVFTSARSRHTLPRHVQLLVKTAGGGPLGVWGQALWHLLMKKKRFHRIVCWDPRWRSLLEWLRTFHRAQLETPSPSATGTLDTRQRLSILLLTKNEAARLPGCLQNIRWADEIVVVDGQSTDQTVPIAQTYGAKVLERPFSGSFAQERNAGLDVATGEWMLQMDADETVSPTLRASIEQLLLTGSTHAAFKIRRRNYFLGHEMRYGGWYHYNLALFRRARARYDGLVHERLQVQGTIGILEGDLVHRPFDSLAQFIQRQNRYTDLQARERVADPAVSLGRLRYELCVRPLKLWWKFYVKKQGFGEGPHGFVFSALFAWVHFLKWAKYWELVSSSTPQTAGEHAPRNG